MKTETKIEAKTDKERETEKGTNTREKGATKERPEVIFDETPDDRV